MSPSASAIARPEARDNLYVSVQCATCRRVNAMSFTARLYPAAGDPAVFSFRRLLNRSAFAAIRLSRAESLISRQRPRKNRSFRSAWRRSSDRSAWKKVVKKKKKQSRRKTCRYRYVYQHRSVDSYGDDFTISSKTVRTNRARRVVISFRAGQFPLPSDRGRVNRELLTAWLSPWPEGRPSRVDCAD